MMTMPPTVFFLWMLASAFVGAGLGWAAGHLPCMARCCRELRERRPEPPKEIR